LFPHRVHYDWICNLCTGHGNHPVMSPANSGMPVFNTPGFQPVSSVSKPEMQAAHGNRFGIVPGSAGPWQPQINGVPASSVHGAQQIARGPPLPTNASPFPQQYNRPPSVPSPDAGLQSAMSAPVPVGPPPAVCASPVQVSSLHCSYITSGES